MGYITAVLTKFIPTTYSILNKKGYETKQHADRTMKKYANATLSLLIKRKKTEPMN